MRFPFPVAVLLACLLAALPAAASDLIVKPSRHPVAATLDRLTAALAVKGITPVARIDHAAAAKASGLELKPTQVLLFGNPRLGTPLMQADRHAAIDLPMRVLAWEDEQGKTWIAYTRPDTFKTRFGLAGQDAVLASMAGALEAFTKAAAE